MSSAGPAITKLTIEGFKSIALAELKPARLNILIGANGSGKTNLLEAIGLLGCAVSGKVDEEAMTFRGMRSGLLQTALGSRPGDPGPIRIDASVGEVEYEVSLDPRNGGSGRWSFIRETLSSSGSRIALRERSSSTLVHADGRELQPAPDARGGVLPLLRGVRTDAWLMEALDRLETYAIYSPTTPMLRGLVRDPSRSSIGLMGGNLGEAVSSPSFRMDGRSDALLDSLRELIDWVEDVRLDPETRGLEFKDRRMLPPHQWLSTSVVAEGPLYALFLLVLLLYVGAPTTCAVDNVDNALNPRLARELIRLVQSLLRERIASRQLFLAIHNPLVLDALDLRDEELTRLFVVDRALGGQTVVRRITPGAALDQARASGRTLSMLWVAGELTSMRPHMPELDRFVRKLEAPKAAGAGTN